MIRQVKFRDAAMYAVPGISYAINNNLEIYALGYMDVTTNRLLNNLKIITTAIFFRVIMNQKQSKQQYVALVLLLFGSCLGSMSTGNKDDGDFFITTFGVILMILYACVSGFASVFNEYIMKNGSGCENIFLQNIILYAWGILFNSTGMMYSFFASSSSSDLNSSEGDLVLSEYESSGYGFVSFLQLVWWTLFVLNGALHGLVISGVMKYLSSIWKLFMSACAIVFAMTAQILVMGASISLSIVSSLVCTASALYLYKTPGVLFKSPETSSSQSYSAVELSETNNNKGSSKTSSSV